MSFSFFKPVKYVIFDMDGLLLDTESLYVQIFNEILGKYNRVYSSEIKNKVLGTVPKDRNSIFIKELNLPVTLEKLTEEIHLATLSVMGKANFMPGAERLINHLHSSNVPIAIATSSDQQLFEVKIERHIGTFKMFHHIVVGSSDPEVKKGKPAPDVFLVCASRFDEKPKPEECLVFEDAPNGVRAAVSAGMQVIMVPDSDIGEEDRKFATKVIPSLLNFKPEEFGLPKFPN